MHELSIAMSIADAAAEEALRYDGTRVSAVFLRLGDLSGVVKDALLFSWEASCEGTPLAGARLVIEETRGKDLQVSGLEIEDL
ncbi:MAG TPA: hydrogenase maturation nickel metallochaperone HypA [Bryobacteraceae bacterium]|jgi:hydrogenase nickel incorporation protein HypA/HybF|nr:hydrogenase maturation nickel metallochaperone HypA [Bryobacteraceae bacterium]